MRLILKGFTVLFVFVLSVIVAAMSFLNSISKGILTWVSGFLGLLGVASFFFGGGISITAKISLLVIAFLISPFGIPAVVDWIIDLCDDFNCSLKDFITS